MSVPIYTKRKDVEESVNGRTWRVSIFTDTAHDPHYYPITAHQEAAYYEREIDNQGQPIGERKLIKTVRTAIPADAGDPGPDNSFPDSHGGLRTKVDFDPVILAQVVDSVTYEGITVPGTHFLPLIRAAIDAMRDHFTEIDRLEAVARAKEHLGIVDPSSSSDSSEG